MHLLEQLLNDHELQQGDHGPQQGDLLEQQLDEVTPSTSLMISGVNPRNPKSPSQLDFNLAARGSHPVIFYIPFISFDLLIIMCLYSFAEVN